MVVTWEVTRACALDCKYCRMESFPHNDPMELGVLEAKRFIDQVARAKPQMLILTGGDLMYRRDLVQIIEYASSQDLSVMLSPSVTPRFLKAGMEIFRDAGLKTISLSLDGACQATHDGFRGVRGMWDWAFQAIDAAKKAGVSVQINTLITRHNIDEFDAFVELLNKVGPAVWRLFVVVPASLTITEVMPTGGQLEELFNRLVDLAPLVPYEITTMEGQHYRRVALQRWHEHGGRESRIDSINDGKGSVFVSHVGDIHPGEFLPLSAGNVRTDELLDVYRQGALFRELRNSDLLKGKCGRCEFRNRCGGSRARAYAVTGDYLAEEPFCDYQPDCPAEKIEPAPRLSHRIWRMHLDD